MYKGENIEGFEGEEEIRQERKEERGQEIFVARGNCVGLAKSRQADQQ